jgi:hypothetical protein
LLARSRVWRSGKKPYTQAQVLTFKKLLHAQIAEFKLGGQGYSD